MSKSKKKRNTEWEPKSREEKHKGKSDIQAFIDDSKPSVAGEATEHTPLSAREIREEIRTLTPSQKETSSAPSVEQRHKARRKATFEPDFTVILPDAPPQPDEIARSVIGVGLKSPASSKTAEIPHISLEGIPSVSWDDADDEEQDSEDGVSDEIEDNEAYGEDGASDQAEDSEVYGEDIFQSGRRYAFAPHAHTSIGTQGMMVDVMIALLPALCWSVFAFGWRVLTVTLLSVFSCVVCELWFALIARRPVTVGDGSAAVSGILLAFLLPANVPLWIVPIGAILAMAVCKGLFGGIGHNWLNPALCSALALRLLFGTAMSARPAFGAGYPAFSLWPQIGAALNEPTASQSFFGTGVGTIGSVSALMLLLGSLYLFCRRIADWRTPAAFCGVMCLLSYLFSGGTDALLALISPLCSGAVLLPALFMATDPVTSPLTARGRLLSGVIGGLLAFALGNWLFAYVGDLNAMIAVAAVGLLSRPLDRLIRPAPFGAYSALLRAEKKFKKGSSHR